MNSTKYLLKNISLLTLGQFGSKILSFLLVPLYTNILTTTEYGTYDIINSTIALLIPILTLNIADSALRFSIDKDNEKTEVLKVCLHYLVFSIVLIAILLIIINLFGVFDIIREYQFEFVFLYIVTALSSILTNYIRGLEKIKVIAISGIISSFIIILLNIIFLVALKWGLRGYFWATIIGILFQIIYCTFYIENKRKIVYKKTNKKLKKEMIIYSKPMIINNIAWWINNLSDRYVIIGLCGVAANGIYSVSYKIPSILTIFQNIFNQSWILSAIKDFDKEDENNFFTNTYNRYNIIMIIVCSSLIIFTRFIAKLLYAKEFYTAWNYVPFLLISVVFGALSGYLGGIYGAVKDTKMFAKSTFISAIINVVLNIILVRIIGPIGAAIATAISYIIIWIIRLKGIKKYINLKYNLYKDISAYVILFLQSSVLYILDESIIYYTVQFVLLFLIIIIYKNNIKNVFKFIKKRYK